MKVYVQAYPPNGPENEFEIEREIDFNKIQDFLEAALAENRLRQELHDRFPTPSNKPFK